MRRAEGVRQAALFVALSGVGWLLDTAVFVALAGPGGWGVLPANLVSGSCGGLLVFAVSSLGLFRRNTGPMPAKIGVLLAFNLVVILAASVLLAGIAAVLRSPMPGGWLVPPGLVPLGAKVLVTPVTLALNFVVVRWLLERFVGTRRRAVAL